METMTENDILKSLENLEEAEEDGEEETGSSRITHGEVVLYFDKYIA